MVAENAAACNSCEHRNNDGGQLAAGHVERKRQSDRHADCERAPGRTGSERHDSRNDEDDCRQQMRRQQTFRDRNDEVCGTHGLGQAVYRVREREQDNSRESALDAAGQGVHDFLERDALDHHADAHEDNNERERFHGLRRLERRIGAHGDRDDNENRKQEVQENARLEARVRLHTGQFLAGQRLSAVREDLAGLHGALLRLLHRAEVLDDAGRDKADERNREQGVEVERDCLDEQHGSVLLRCDAADADRQTAQVSRPAGDRNEHADRSRGGVRDVRELFARDTRLIRNAAHGAADEQRAERVAEVYEHTQHPCDELRALAAQLLVMYPLRKSLNCAGLLEIRNQNADHRVQQHDPRKAGRTQIFLEQRRKVQQQDVYQTLTLMNTDEHSTRNAGNRKCYDGILGAEGQCNGKQGGNDRNNPHTCEFFHLFLSLL